LTVWLLDDITATLPLPMQTHAFVAQLQTDSAQRVQHLLTQRVHGDCTVDAPTCRLCASCRCGSQCSEQNNALRYALVADRTMRCALRPLSAVWPSAQRTQSTKCCPSRQRARRSGFGCNLLVRSNTLITRQKAL
jgi:hypothetical protein